MDRDDDANTLFRRAEQSSAAAFECRRLAGLFVRYSDHAARLVDPLLTQHVPSTWSGEAATASRYWLHVIDDRLRRLGLAATDATEALLAAAKHYDATAFDYDQRARLLELRLRTDPAE